jgi:lipopolysaccharide export system permease protein
MNKIDRYILNVFFQALGFALLSICVLFIILDIIQNLDRFLDRHTPIRIIALYYVNFLPDIIRLIMPIVITLAGVFTFNKLSTTHEVVVPPAGGMSVFRMMVPILVAGMILSSVQLYFNGWIAPKALKAKADIERLYLQQGKEETTLYNIYLRDAALRNVFIRYYDHTTKSGNGMVIEEYSSEEQPRILRRIDAPTFQYDTIRGVWQLQRVMEHRFSSPLTYHTGADFPHTLDMTINMQPDDIISLQRDPQFMNFPELKSFIDLSERGGKDTRKDKITYYGHYAYPFANFIVLLFSIPNISGKRKGGMSGEIAMGLAISFLYLGLTKVSQTVAGGNDLHPIISGWIANGAFLFAGLVFAVVRMR